LQQDKLDAVSVLAIVGLACMINVANRPNGQSLSLDMMTDIDR